MASTSSERSVRAVLTHAVGPEPARKLLVLAGDVVTAKKPDPEIYELAVERLGVRKDEVVVVEDSRNGLVAADAAGLLTVITMSNSPAGEDCSEAALVLSDLGDPGAPMTVIANRTPITPTEITWRSADLESTSTAPSPWGRARRPARRCPRLSLEQQAQRRRSVRTV